MMQQRPPLSEPSTPPEGYSHLKVGVQPCCHPTLQMGNLRLGATPQSHPAYKPQLWELDTCLALGTRAKPPTLLPVNLRKPLQHMSRGPASLTRGAGNGLSQLGLPDKTPQQTAVPRDWKSQLRRRADVVPVRAPFHACGRQPSRCVPTRWRETETERRRTPSCW